MKTVGKPSEKSRKTVGKNWKTSGKSLKTDLFSFISFFSEKNGADIYVCLTIPRAKFFSFSRQITELLMIYKKILAS